jgi:magnesium-transporting ATPase (P-type)
MQASDSRRDDAAPTEQGSGRALDVESLADTAWHALDAEQAAQALGSDREGLDEQEASRRRRRFGPNRLPEERRAGLLLLFLRQFRSPLIYILLAAAVASLAIAAYADAVFIFAVRLLDSVIGSFQESEAESSS